MLILVFLWLHLVQHTAGRIILLPKIVEFRSDALQDNVIETMLVGESSVQGPILLKLLFVGIKTVSPSVTAKHYNIHCVPFKVSIICWYHFSIR